jgi:hypothetical protein
VPLVEKLRALAGQLALEAFEGVAPDAVESLREALARVRDNISTTESQKSLSA